MMMESLASQMQARKKEIDSCVCQENISSHTLLTVMMVHQNTSRNTIYKRLKWLSCVQENGRENLQVLYCGRSPDDDTAGRRLERWDWRTWKWRGKETKKEIVCPTLSCKWCIPTPNIKHTSLFFLIFLSRFFFRSCRSSFVESTD